MSSQTTLRPVTDVVFAVRDAADTLPPAIAELPSRLVRSVVVVECGSRDATAQAARDAGAVVLRAGGAGYGAACRRAVAHLEALPRPPDVVVFCAGDGSDDPSELPELLEPIESDNAELVIGVRGGRGAQRPLTARVALGLIGAIYRHKFEDLGPFRAVRFPALVAMGLTDDGAGYNVEMQVKAVCLGLQIVEVPVRTRESGGSRPLWRSARRGARMVAQILKHATMR